MIPYILHVALLISLCLLFYKVLLQKETFYHLNRWVLMSCLALAFALPLISVPQQWALRAAPKVTAVSAPEADNYEQYLNLPQTETAKKPEPIKPQAAVKQQASLKLSAPISEAASIPSVPLMQRIVKLLFYLYWIGVAAFGLNLLLQLVVLLYQAYTSPAIRDGKFRIVELSGDKAPCSFGNNIFINPQKYDWETYNQILLHEKVHIEQRHSIDILLAELVLVLQWFNPFAWVYRTELEKNLEFLADDAVLSRKEIERSSYQMSLLKVATPHLSLGITTNYNQSLLKKRIVMMNSKKSNIHTMWKYFFLVPLLGCLVCALNDPAAIAQTTQVIDANVNARVNPVINATVNPIVNTSVNTAVRASIKPYINANINPVVNANITPVVHTNVNTVVNAAVNPFVNANVNAVVNPMISMHLNVSPNINITADDMNEGSWFATIKGDRVRMEFRNDDEDHHWSNSEDFLLSEFPKLPRDQKADFSIKREAGTVVFNGKFDGDQGYGHYKFTADKAFMDFIKESGVTDLRDRDAFVFFTVNLKKDYIAMLQRNGIKDMGRNHLISMAAMKVDEPFIKMWKQNGFEEITPNQLVSGKALNIDEAYIKEIRGTGYTQITFNQLVSFKSQNITGDYIRGLKKEKAKDGGEGEMPSANEIVAYKSMNIDAAYVNSFKAIGYDNIPYHQLTAMKSMDITPEYVKGFMDLGYKDIPAHDLVSLKSMKVDAAYIKSFEDAGYKNIPVHDLVALKSQNITPGYAKSFETTGLKDVSVHELVALKSQDITAEYIKGFVSIGYKDISAHTIIALKSMGITPSFVDGFKKIGFTDIPLNELPALKSTGVTPGYVSSMQAKGFKSDNLRKYIQLKNSFN
jgi:hypothetical protein